MPELKWNADLYNKQHQFVYKYGASVIEWLDPKPGENILDLGCGTGELTHIISESGARVTGVDASPEMISKATYNFPEIKFDVRNACELGFENSFDAVFSNAVLHWINRQKEAIENIFRSLKKGGRFVFEMGGKGNNANILHALKQAFISEKLEPGMPREQYYFPSVAEQCALLEQVGFTVSDVCFFKRPTRLEGEQGMKHWMEQFCGFFFRGLTELQKEKITNQTVDSLRQSNYINGEWIADYVRLKIKAIK